MKQRVDFFSGQEVLVEDMAHEQQGRQAAEHALQTDFWRDGILRDPNGLSNFTVTVDSTTNTLFNVGWGTAYANGKRISVFEDVTYNAANPTQTINGICTPQSSGNRGIPLANYTSGVSNFVWAEYLEVSRTNPRSVSVFDGSVHYPHRDDGYRIVVTTANAPGNPNGITNSVYLATVFGQGTGNALLSSPTGITDLGGTYASLIPKDSLGTQNYQDRSITPQKLRVTGENYIFDGACFTTLVASSYANVPIQPFYANGAASKKFAQYAGFGIAISKTVFRPTYDGYYRLIQVSIEGDSTGTITPEYDGLCSITSITETIDNRTVKHHFTYISQDGASLINSVTEDGV